MKPSGFIWGEEDKLREIQLIHSWSIWSACTEGRDCFVSEQDLGEFPDFWKQWLYQFEKYVIAGEPLGPIPWERIDQGAWTEFQKDVYKAIEHIPHGETRTYSWVASKLNRRGASRAVGQALRNNPVPVIIPCHRVVGSGKNIGGFMGKTDPGQPELLLKKRLIELENQYTNPIFPFLAEFQYEAAQTA